MRLTIRFPNDAEPLLKISQETDFATPLYKKKSRSQQIISISEKLGVSPKKIFSHVVKFVGDTVEKNELIAVKKGLFSTKKILAQDRGLIKEINHEDGKVVIENSSDGELTYAYFKGRVEELKKDAAAINLGPGKEFDLKFASADFGAEVCIVRDELTLTNLNTQSAAGKIIVAESINSFAQTKLEALGACGFVTSKKIDAYIVASAQIKSPDDMKKILPLEYCCCVIDKTSGKIYFYG